MNEKTKELPACPVETTLTLIGDKMEGFDIKGFNVRNKAFWRVEKIHRHGIAKGVDCTAS